MKTNIKKYAAHIGAAAVVITAVASAAVTPLPGSLPASVANGDIIEASHINDILSSLNILDQRTDGDAPVDNVDIVNKGYLDTAVSAAGDWQKGVICPDGEIFQGYNADESAKCETPESLGIGGGGGSTAPDVTGLTGFGTMVQRNINGRNFVVYTDETQDCSALGANWLPPASMAASTFLSVQYTIPAVHATYYEGANVCAGKGHDQRIYILDGDSHTDYFDSTYWCGGTADADSYVRVCEYSDI